MDFNSSVKDLESRINRLIPMLKEINSSYKRLDMPDDELKATRDTIEEAQELVRECSQVSKFDFYNKAKYTRKIKKINEVLLHYCQTDMQLLQRRTLMQIMGSINVISDRMDGMICNLGRNNFMGLCSPPEPQTVTVGLDRPVTELKKRLFDKGTSTIVVSSPPGCGKTTLVTKLCHDEEVKGYFKGIFFVIVSKTPNFRVIVQNLFQHNGYAAPAFVNDEDATNRLQLLLEQIGQKNPILLVLDDAWHGIDSMLKKFVVQLPNYKILVASRFDLPGFDSTYHLKFLEDNDARTLLIEQAGQPVGISSIDYEDLLQKILNRCKGYPLVIKGIGNSLKNRSLTTWKSLILKLSEGNKILNTVSPGVLECLQTSVDALDTNVKECFSDLGLFPEDQKICASTIVDISMELYDLNEDYDAMKFLKDLSSQSLLTLLTVGRNEDEDGFFSEYVVTQHSILRELAAYQSELETVVERKRLNIEIRNDRFPDWCLNLTQPINARLLSISTDESFSSRWFDMNSPTVEVVVLNFATPNYALPGFITKMERLKVLTVINSCFFPTKVSNLSCINLPPNLKRIRFEKVLITSLNISQLQLKSLQKLSLAMCNIKEVFYDFHIDISSALPSLHEIDIDHCNDLEELPYWIYEVISLRKLSIINCNTFSKLPEAIGNLINLEVLRLNSCIDFFELPGTIERLQKLCHLDISNCLSLKKLPSQIGTLRSLKKISMRKCSIGELPMSVQNLEGLQELKCDEEIAYLWQQFKPDLVNLEINV